MTTEILVALAAAALLGFWVLGAYNRLVELRNLTAEAWAQAAEAQRRRGDALQQLLAALQAPLTSEASALDALGSAHEQASRAAAQMSARPLQRDRAAAWVDAETRLLAAASRVFALVESAGELAREEPIAAATAAWRESAQRLGYTRQLFNDAAAAHDEALQVFPTSLLVRVFGFAPAGRV